MRRLWLLLPLGCISCAWAAPLDDAIARYQEKNYSEADSLLLPLSESEGGNAAVWHWLGKSARKQGRTADAVRYQEKAISLEPKRADYWMGLGDAYGDMAKGAPLFEKLSLAKKCHDALAKAIELDPESMPARSAMIDFCRQAPEIAGGGKARAYAEAESYKRVNLEGGTQLQVTLLMVEKKFNEATIACDEALHQLPDSYALHFAYGRAAALGGIRVPEGIAHLKKCLELPPGPNAPGPAAIWFRLGDLYSKNGDKEAARDAYVKALELDPNLPEVSERLKAL